MRLEVGLERVCAGGRVRRNHARIVIRPALSAYVVTLVCVWGRASRVVRDVMELPAAVVDLLTHLPPENVYPSPIVWLGDGPARAGRTRAPRSTPAATRR